MRSGIAGRGRRGRSAGGFTFAGQQTLESLGERRAAFEAALSSRAIDRVAQPIGIDRLEHVVDGVHLERPQCVAIVGRDEHDERHRVGADALDDLEPGGAAELDVEQHEVGPADADRGNRFVARRAFTDARRVRHPLEFATKAASRERLVVDDQHSHAGATENGIVISTRVPAAVPPFPAEAESHHGTLAIESSQSLTGIGQPDALAELPASSGARAVVLDRETQHTVAPRGAKRDGGRRVLLGPAVLDRILDERLEQQHRDTRVGGRGVDVERDDQPVAEARALDVEIVVEENELLAQRHLVLLFIEAATQQRSEPNDHRARARRVLEREDRDRIERVEQKMRPQLRAERVELRASELALERGAAAHRASRRRRRSNRRTRP